MKRIIALALVLPVFLVGCGAQEASEPGTNTVQDSSTDTGYGDGHIIPDNEYWVKKFKVDGTTCVAFNDGGAGGISCDWNDQGETNGFG